MACIVKHADPQINSVGLRGVFNKARPKVEADVLYNLARVQIYSIDEYTASLKL